MLAQKVHFNTFGGNPVSCAAANAVLEVIQGEDLLSNCAAIGAYFKAGLQGLAERLGGSSKPAAVDRSLKAYGVGAQILLDLGLRSIRRTWSDQLTGDDQRIAGRDPRIYCRNA